jgi:tRNA G46 methylase TrmB
MGRASRRKRVRVADDIEPVKHSRRQVEEFLRRAGLDRQEPQLATWTRLRETFPRAEVDELEAAVTAHARDEQVPAPYGLMWRSTEWAKETYGWFAPITGAWLTWLRRSGLRATRILDVGCGPGVHSCFIAEQLPEAEVIGADISREGIAVGQDLALELGLTNVRFVQADFHTLSSNTIGGKADLVLASTVFADAHPEAFGRLLPADPWSTTRSVELALSNGHVDGLGAVAEIVETGGTYVGVERASGPVSYANWIAGLSRAGFTPDPSRATGLDVRMWGVAERIPLVVAVRDNGAGVDLADLNTFVRRQFVHDFKVEDALHDDPPTERLWGVEISVDDQSGIGQTRIEYFKLESSRIIRLASTSRGYRELQEIRGDIADRLEEERNSTTSLLLREPTVTATRELGPEIEERSQ